MNELNKIQPYLDGCFSILITGERGIGKTRLVENGFRNWRLPSTGFELKNENHQFIECLEEIEDWKGYLAQKLKSSVGSYLIIENIEHLKYEKQVILNRYLSTLPGGYYKLLHPAEIRSQIIITSSLSLSELYNSEKTYAPLIDRIAQQVIELKPIRSGMNRLGKEIAFKKVWEEMMFKKDGQLCPYPEQDLNEDFYVWLDTLYLAGNYRDLQKIAIYVWRELLNSTRTRNLLDEVKEKFSLHTYEPASHFFRYNASADDILKDFKWHLAEWAEKKYPDTKTALDILGIAEKTLYNWKNKK